MACRASWARRNLARSRSWPRICCDICLVPWRNVPVYRTASEEETIALGERLAREFKPGTVVLLIGNLGAGKTTLAKGIVKGLHAAPAEEVSSPTFTLIHEYGTPPAVYHIDLYRLDDA